MMRYFFFSYTAKTAHGYITKACESFPSNEALKDDVKRLYGSKVDRETIIIMHIYEFKDEADFLAFRSK